MNALLHSPKGKIGAIAVGGLVVFLALWFLLVSPQRAKATEVCFRPRLDPGAARRAQGRPRDARRPTSAFKPSDLYRLTKALPDDTNMSGILLDVNRIAAQNKLTFIVDHTGPAGQRNRISAAAARRDGAGPLQQPLEVPR